MLNLIRSAYERHCHPPPRVVRTPPARPVPQRRERPQNLLAKVHDAAPYLEPDLPEPDWTFGIVAPLARAARDYPEIAAELQAAGRAISRGDYRPQPSVDWVTPGQHNGQTGEQVFERNWTRFLSEPYHGQEATLGSFFHRAQAAGWRYALERFDREPHPPMNPEAFPQRRETGGRMTVPETIPNYEALFQHYEITCRYNLIKNRIDISFPGLEGTPEHIHASAMANIISLLKLNGLGTSQVTAYVAEIANRHPYNPVLDWIQSQPWDGQDRLPLLADTLTTPADFPKHLKHKLLNRWLRSAVAALIKPGFHTRGILTLQSAQSMGKTTWLKNLINDPVLADAAFLEGHHIDPRDKDTLLTAISHWQVELGELESTLRKDLAGFKAFITQSHDKKRPPYGTVDIEYPRRTVFCVSVNQEDFLIDPTGNTRFWVLPLTAINYDHGLDMQQIWAQLLVEVEQGGIWWLTKAEEELLESRNQDHMVISTVEERVMAILNLELPTEQWQDMTPTELLIRAGIPQPRNVDAKACATLLGRILPPPFDSNKKINGIKKWKVPVIPIV